MRPSMRLRFIISVAAGFLCGDLVAAAQTYSPNDPYWLRPNPTHGGLSTEDYYLPGGAQRAPRGTVRSRRPSVMPSDADPAYSSAEGFDDEVDVGRDTRRTVIDPTWTSAGTITINTGQRKLYLGLGGGRAMKYGIGVGRRGFEWKGEARSDQSAFWPGWTPPKEMIAHQPGSTGPHGRRYGKPTRRRALYLFQGGKDTLLRIHGTNEPARWAVPFHLGASGC